MAGNYPDVNSWRMAYDVDGTQMFRMGTGATGGSSLRTEATASDLNVANNEENNWTWAETDASQTDRWYLWIFPELRDLDGWVGWFQGRTAGNPGRSYEVFCSPDTTNGIDGTWVNVGSYSGSAPPKPGLREINYSTVLGVKAVKIRVTGDSYNGVGSVHFYGEPIPGVNLQRLEIWHPTLDQRLGPADLDWGDVPRNSEEIRTFRVKNMHPTLTAIDVRVAMSILTDTTPSVVGQQALSKNGVTWAAQQMLDAPLGPEEISPVMQVRRQTLSNATLSLWWYRLFADSTSWTEEV